MRNVRKITGEALLADLAVEDLFLLALLAVLDPADILLDVEVLLPAGQHAPVATSSGSCLVLGRLFGLPLLEGELFASPVVHLSGHFVLGLLIGHLF